MTGPRRPTASRNLALPVAVALLTLATAPRAEGPDGAATPAPGPTLSLHGVHDSTWGRVDLKQGGTEVSGFYRCRGTGHIAGTLAGTRIESTWTPASGRGGGKGVWTVEGRGRELVGTWGSGSSATSGGRWDLARRAEPDPG